MAQENNPLCAAALDYLSLGWSVIPLCDGKHEMRGETVHRHPAHKRGKVPLLAEWTTYQRERATAERVREWWSRWPKANVGIVTGAISALVRIDADSESDTKALREVCGGDLPPTLVFCSGRGEGYLFRWPDDAPAPPAHAAFPGTTISYIGEGGQTVAPPSVHHTGRKYEWVGACRPGETVIAEIPEGILRALDAHKSRKGKPENEGGVFVPAPGEEEYWYRRAEGWAKGAPPSVQGVDGHRKVFALACRLIHTFHQAPAAAAQLMAAHWSPRCEPPWDRAELEYECGRAAERGGAGPIPDKRGRATPRPAAAPAPRADEPPPAAPPAPADQQPADPPGYEPGNSRKPLFRLASSLKRRPVSWLHEPWIQRGKLSAVCGMPGTGKSTFGMWLIKQAGRVVVLPGSEEGADDELLDRMEVARVPQDDVAIADTKRWSFPTDRDRFAEVVLAHRAALVWIDPVDSYVTEGSENDGPYVRAALESLAWVAEKTGAAVVFARHPGKAAGNIMPGSRSWFAVPRTVIELLVDRARENKRIIRPEKRSRGREAPACYYRLVGQGDEARVFVWEGPVEKGVVEEIKEEPDRINRRKIERARHLVRALLAEGGVSSREVLRAGLDEGLNDRCMERAAADLGVIFERSGNGSAHKCVWALPGGSVPSLPTSAESHTHTPRDA